MASDHKHSGWYSLRNLIKIYIYVHTHTHKHKLFDLFWIEIYFG